MGARLDRDSLDDHLYFTTSTEDDAVVLIVGGDIDIGGAPTLQAEIEGLAHKRRGLRAVVDLSHVTFLDSSGLRALLAGSRALGAGVVLRNPSRPVRRVLDLAVPGLFTIED